jgi:LacI family gluconate utilization system Gnt-I transcriptional repressor
MFAGLVQTFADSVRQAGYEVMLSLSGYGDNEAQVRALLGRRPDALLITGAAHSKVTRQMLSEAQIPIVEIWDVSDNPIDMLVGFDHAEVGQAVAGFFQDKGHERYAVFSAGDPRALIRTNGFTAAIRRAGGIVLAEPVLPAPSTITAGREALRALLPMLDRPVALFCSSDLLAFGAITEARLHGVAVPDRLAVCGFGNFELSAMSEPAFTTVNVEGAQIGRTAAELLLARLVGGGQPDVESRIHVPFRIVERASS